MSTSHYSRPFQGPIPPNKRRYTTAKLATISGLFIIDLLALIGSTDIVESLGLVILMGFNLWAINCTRP